jgi:hypothetical protein
LLGEPITLAPEKQLIAIESSGMLAQRLANCRRYWDRKHDRRGQSGVIFACRELSANSQNGDKTMGPQPAAPTNAVAKRPVRWLELLLVIVAEMLFFQLVPDAWPRLKHGIEAVVEPVAGFLGAIVDVRQWTVTGTAIRLVIVLLFLVGLKAWKDRAI